MTEGTIQVPLTVIDKSLKPAEVVIQNDGDELSSADTQSDTQEPFRWTSARLVIITSPKQ